MDFGEKINASFMFHLVVTQNETVLRHTCHKIHFLAGIPKLYSKFDVRTSNRYELLKTTPRNNKPKRTSCLFLKEKVLISYVLTLMKLRGLASSPDGMAIYQKDSFVVVLDS